MKSTRQNKVARLIQKELSEILQKDYEYIFNKIMISVTSVRISIDFSYARVFLSIFPAKDPAQILGLVKKNKSNIRMELGKRVRYQLRLIPDLHFYLDDSAEYTNKIEELLKK